MQSKSQFKDLIYASIVFHWKTEKNNKTKKESTRNFIRLKTSAPFRQQLK